MSKNTNVSAAVVRTWARENTDLVRAHAEKIAGESLTDEQFAPMVASLGTGARGRLGAVVLAAFEANSKGQRYSEDVKVTGKHKPVEQAYRSLDKRGRNITRTWRGTVQEARVLSGQGSKGRLNMNALTEALESEWRAAQPADA